jgi:serine protease
MLTFAVIAFACSTIGGSVATATPAPAAAITSQPHVMLSLPAYRAAHEDDCALPVVILVTCLPVGLPMNNANGPINSYPNGGPVINSSSRVYIVYWQMTSDPSGEKPYQLKFFNGLGGTPYIATQTQYCQGTTDVTGYVCPATATFVGNPANLVAGTWSDTANPIPVLNNMTEADATAALAAEAVRAANHFGNTTPASNANVQYIIDTPHNNSTPGFAANGGGYCAWHNNESDPAVGDVHYTNFPYMPDGGGSCGVNFVNSGSAGLLDGVSIVGGHEFAETITDPIPANSWTDEIGQETGDKCAWMFVGPGASQDIGLSTGIFAVQSLWSNAPTANGLNCRIS